jgi:hypothetical protein
MHIWQREGKRGYNIEPKGKFSKIVYINEIKYQFCQESLDPLQSKP